MKKSRVPAKKIYEIIADIAMVFHWSRDDLMNIPEDELEMWHKMAVERFKLCH